MRLKTLLAVFFFFLMYSCSTDPCKQSANCFDEFQSLFRVTNKTNGADLVFGPSRIYDANAIKIFSAKNGDTSFHHYKPERWKGNDSALFLKLSTKMDTLYVQLSRSDVDTMVLSYGQTTSRCCWAYKSIISINFNNTGEQPNRAGEVFLKK
jgi:hypothetical protein